LNSHKSLNLIIKL